MWSDLFPPPLPVICLLLSFTDVTVCFRAACNNRESARWIFMSAPHGLYSQMWLIHCVLWQQVVFSSGCKWWCLKSVSYGGAHLCALGFSFGSRWSPCVIGGLSITLNLKRFNWLEGEASMELPYHKQWNIVLWSQSFIILFWDFPVTFTSDSHIIFFVQSYTLLGSTQNIVRV